MSQLPTVKYYLPTAFQASSVNTSSILQIWKFLAKTMVPKIYFPPLPKKIPSRSGHAYLVIGPCLAANNGLNSLGRLFKVGLTHTAVLRNQWASGILCERVA